MTQTVNKALIILEYIAEAGEPVRLVEIARACGQHKTTAHRLLETLTKRGYVHKDPRNSRYSPGFRIFAIGRKPKQIETYVRQADPFIRRLAYECGQAAHLVALEGRQIVYLDKVEPPGSVSGNVTLGMRVDAHATAAGKSIIMLRPPAEIAALYPGKQLPVHTTKTLNILSKLEAELAISRTRGYATENGELIAGLNAVSAPIINSIHRATIAFAIVGQATDFNPRSMPRYGKIVCAAAKEFSTYLLKREPDQETHV